MNKLALLLGIFASSAAFSMECDIDLDLKSFHLDPKSFMNKPVVKLDSDCKKVEGKSKFSDEDIASKNYIQIKDSYRKNLCHYDSKTKQKICLKSVKAGRDIPQGRSGIESFDSADNLVSGGVKFTSILDMNSHRLQFGSVATLPWSDWFWPISFGQLSYRYADENMVEALKYSGSDSEHYWPHIEKWFANNNAFSVRSENLSPAEKYDILVGDTDFTLTKSMLMSAEYYHKKDGKIESWMGICNGWSAASVMIPRPSRSISVLAADGKTYVEFRPSDLKALASQLWASGKQTTNFMGGRCNTKDPKTDRFTGRILDQDCFDTNPGAFHKAIVNQVGINKKSFVMDATFDYQVWNFPVVSYSYVYVNPSNMRQYRNVRQNIVPVNRFRNDKFRKFRSSEAVYVVGVKMEVKYAVETHPTSSSWDNSSQDEHETAYYVYDLELDGNYNVIGGEWYQKEHPDFLWSPADGSHAESIVDDYIKGDIDLGNLRATQLKELAPEASRNSQPVGKLVEALLRSAQ